MRVVELLTVLALLTGSVCGDASKKLCKWSQARSGTVRNGSYLDGGSIQVNNWQDGQWLSGSTPIPVENNQGYLWRFNYTQAFTSGSTNYEDIFEPMQVGGGSLEAPNYVDGAIFVDDYEFYTYGGLIGETDHTNNTVNYRLYPIALQDQFSVAAKTSYMIDGAPKHITHGADVSIPSEKLAFYFGGMRAPDDAELGIESFDNLTYPLELSDLLVKVDMASPGNAVWSTSQIPGDIKRRAGGKMVWIPVGQRGLLVVLGGVVYPQDLYDSSLNSTQIQVNTDQSQSFMTEIPVYDVANSKWYNQTTSGDSKPPGLMQFCAVTASADNSSFEIFMYGGYNGQSGTSLGPSSDEVWILSLPSFKWVKANSGTSAHARSGHACFLPYPDQMLLIGGQDLTIDLSGNTCVKDGSLFDIFSLNDLQWTGKYDPSKGGNYKIPSIVASLNPTEKAAGMSAELAALFDTKYAGKEMHYYPYETVHTPGGKSSMSTGAKVGIAIGALLAVIAVVVLLWYCYFYRRKQRQHRASGSVRNIGSDILIPHWLSGVHKGISETTTEVGNNESFTHRVGELDAEHHIAEVRGDKPLSSGRAMSPLSPRPPLSAQTGSAEVDGVEVHEMPADLPKGFTAFSINRMQNNHRRQNHSINSTLATSNSPSSSRANSRISHMKSNFTEDLSPAPSRMSASPIALTPNPDDNDDAASRVRSISPDMSDHGPSRNNSSWRPGHNRHVSDESRVSSQRPISPPLDDESERFMSMDNPDPVSPEFEATERPNHKRNTSSMSTLPLLNSGGEANDRGVNGSTTSLGRKPVGLGVAQTHHEEDEDDADENKKLVGKN